MQTQPKPNLLPISLIVLAGAIVLAALTVVFSPLLWTDHVYRGIDKPVPTSCSIQGQYPMIVIHCPAWVSY